MSTINTNGIDVNYPVPGVNNNSQGFRDNFASIKTNITAAGNEITDLQNKVVVKSALANTTVNNDMAGTLLSNALTRGFRSTTYNLGNALAGTVLVDVSLGDVQYGALAANTALTFTGWTTDGQNSVELHLDVTANANAFLSFPAAISSDACLGVTTLENYDSVTNSVSIPAGVCQLDYTLSSVDCGANIAIEPINRPRRSTQIRQRSPSPTGLPGDIAGTVAVDANYVYVCTGTYNSIANAISIANSHATGNLLTVSDTGLLTLNDPIVFTGANVTQANLVANVTYYVKAIATSGVNGNISVSATRTAGTADANVALTSTANSFSAVTYNGTDIWKRIALTTW